MNSKTIELKIVQDKKHPQQVLVKRGRRIEAKIWKARDNFYHLYMNGLMWERNSLDEAINHVCENITGFLSSLGFQIKTNVTRNLKQ